MATAPNQADEMPIYTTQGYVSSVGIKMLGYSRPHKGKTELIRTLPNPFVFASENGLLTLKQHNIPYTPCTNVRELERAVKWIKERKYEGKFSSLVLDSVSYLTVLLLAEFRSDTAKYTNNGQKHYGMMKEKVTDLLDALFASNVNVYVTAWEEEKYDAFGTMTGVYPATEGKALQSYLVHYFDLTFNLDWHTIDVPQADGTTQKEQRPYLQTVEANGKFARSRQKGLDAFEPADLGKLIEKLATLN